MKAVASGDVRTNRTECYVYPILVGDEPALQTFAANRYMDEEFTSQLPTPRPAAVAPLTVMSIDELEELLPYLSAGDASWRDALDPRFQQDGVTPDPFHTTWATFRKTHNIAHRPNSFLSDADERVRARIFERYHFQSMPEGGPLADE